MTTDQISVAQLVVTTAAIFLGPLFGAFFTLSYQRRKEEKDEKNRLFLMLMAHRKSYPPSLELVNSLNLIDAVFTKQQEVVRLWHEYYDLLCQNPVNGHLMEAKYLDLLSEMAKVLGYTTMSQTAIARFYSPNAHVNQANLNFEIQNELLRVLKSSTEINFAASNKTQGSKAKKTNNKLSNPELS